MYDGLYIICLCIINGGGVSFRAGTVNWQFHDKHGVPDTLHLPLRSAEVIRANLALQR